MADGLSSVDWVVVALYFAFALWLAYRVRGNQQTTRDYFLGGRSLPWWAATLSIVATETSAVTFMGVPRMAYAGDWTFLQLVFGFVLGRFFLAAFFVRVFYARDVETVYGYLGERFSPAVEKLAAIVFLAGRVVASGVRLYAGCLALQVAAALAPESLVWAILALGAAGVSMTFAGGIRSVVWTDVVLGLSFMLGAVGALGFLLLETPGGLAAVMESEVLVDKLRVLDLGLALDNPSTLLAGVAGGFVLTLATHGTDQDIAQRMLTCKDSRSGSLSVLASAAVILPLMVLFLAVGTLLFFFYEAKPPAYPLPADGNHLFPVFIARELPPGLSGFVMAGLLAASLSSLTSALNALSATTVNDLLPTREPSPGDGSSTAAAHRRLRRSRQVTVFWGGVLVLAALAFARSEDNILFIALRVLTYFYGALLGAFVLGLFTRRGSPLSVSLGMLASIATVLTLELRNFLSNLDAAPQAVRRVLGLLPDAAARTVLDSIPEIAWPYWIILGTGVCCVVGALGRGPGK